MSKVLIILILSLVTLAAASSFAQPSPSCLNELQTRIMRNTQEQDAWYRAHGGHLPSQQKRTIFSPGRTSTAVLVLHGFISSPSDMGDVIDDLRSQGHTVLAPLITGFGAGAQAANESRIEDWQDSTKRGIETLRMCFPKVVVVAHCLGGALALDQVINEDAAPDVSRLILFAPYVRTYYPGLNILNDIFKTYGSTIDLRWLRLILGLAPERILPIPLPPPAGTPDADPYFPLQAVESALDLQKRFRTGDAPANIEIPVSAAVSDSDQVVDGPFALEYLQSRFSRVSTLRFGATDGVSHYMHHRAQNPRFDALANLLKIPDQP